MKIKTDFVTNSSSTCYVVFVPNAFSITDEMIEKAIDDEKLYWDMDDDDVIPSVENMREEVSECIELLKTGDNIYLDSYGDGVDVKVYSIAHNILSNHGFEMSSVEMSVDGGDTIVGVSEEKIIKALADHIDLSTFITVGKT